MYGLSEDGGAFAECHFAQYPLGMGRDPPPPFVCEAIKTLVRHDGASSSVPACKSLAVVPSVVTTSCVKPPEGSDARDAEKLLETTARTREALDLVIRGRCVEEQERDFSGRGVRHAKQKRPVLELAITGDVGAVGAYDPAPIVRSPTKAPKVSADITSNGNEDVSAEATTVVPFSISNWKNKRKLIISIEQRIAQHAEARPVGGEKISDNVMQLAVAMQRARKEVEAEQASREKARKEEEERRQAEREAEATKRAKEILERTASGALHGAVDRTKETREERLERIRLERELREREKQQELRQRRLAKAAARLGITVEALEADEELLRNVDNPVGLSNDIVSGYVCPPCGHVATVGANQKEFVERPPTLHENETEDGIRAEGASGIRKGVFGSAVISNEGIRREMEALAKLEEAEGNRGPRDGLRTAEEEVSGSDEEDDGLGMDKLMKKRKKRRL